MLSSVDDVLNPAIYGGHIPVLLRETLTALNPRPGAKIIDATFGGGGHTRALLQTAEEVRVLALDRDPAAQDRAVPIEEALGSAFVSAR